MKNIRLFLTFFAAASLFSCEKKISMITAESSTPPVLTATRTTINLAFATKDEEAVKLMWTNPNYMFSTGTSSQSVSYLIEIDTAGANLLKFTVTPYAIPPKVVPPSTGKLYIVGDATPGGWNNPVPVPSQELKQISPTLYEITLPLIADKSYLFLPLNGDWGTKFGSATANNANNVNGDDLKNGGGDIKAPPVNGNYKIQVDFQRGKFIVTKL